MNACLKVGTTVLLLCTTISGCSWLPFHDRKPTIELNEEINSVADQIKKAHCRLKNNNNDGGFQKEVVLEFSEESAPNASSGFTPKDQGWTFNAGYGLKETKKVTVTLDPAKMTCLK